MRDGEIWVVHMSQRGKDKGMCSITKMPSSLSKCSIVKWAKLVTQALGLKDIIFFSIFLGYHLQAHMIK